MGYNMSNQTITKAIIIADIQTLSLCAAIDKALETSEGRNCAELRRLSQVVSKRVKDALYYHLPHSEIIITKTRNGWMITINYF